MRSRFPYTHRACVAACLWCLVLGCDSNTQPDDEPAPKAEAVDVDQSTEAGDQIVAVVNDREVTEAELQDHLDRLGELYRHSNRSFDDAIRESKRNKVLQRLVDRELLRDHATRRDIELDDGQVDRQLRNRVDRAFGSTADFRRYLDDADMTVSDYRDRIREELTLEKVVEERLDDRQLDEQRLERYYDRIANRRPADDRLEASRLQIEIRGVSDDDYHQLEDKLGEAVDDLDDPAELDELGKRIEAWADRRDLASHVAHQDRRWYEQKHLDESASRSLFEATDPAKTRDSARLVDTAMGFDVYWIHRHREAGIREFDEVEELVRDRARRAKLQKQRRALVEELREEADIAIRDRDHNDRGSE